MKKTTDGKNLRSLNSNGYFLKKELRKILTKRYPLFLSMLLSGGKVTKKQRKCRFYSIILRFFENCNFKTDSRGFAEYIADIAVRENISDKDAVLILPFIFDIISRKIALLSENDTQEIEKLYSLCREFSYYDFTVLREKVSVIDKTLAEKGLSEFSDSDEITKNIIRRKISLFAKRHKISEKNSAEIFAENGEFESEKKERKKHICAWFILNGFFSVFLTFTTVLLTKTPIFFAFLLIFPISEFVRYILNLIFSHLLYIEIPYRLKLDKIPDNGKTLVVITSLLSSEDDSVFRDIEEYYLSSREENSRFGLLLDLPAYKKAKKENDGELIEYAKKKTEELNKKYGEKFCLFIRKRVFSKSENTYMGYERKRGAIIDLILFMRGKSDSFIVKIGDFSFLSEAKYLFTLDRDTRLFGSALLKSVSSMMHPKNRPIIKKNRVVSGYGVMQTHISTSLASYGKTYFSSLLSPLGGKDMYENASFDLYQSLFGEGVFCGKGIFDVDAFCELIPDTFADGVVLSHDILEGGILRCGILSDISLCDSHPRSPASFFSRLHRWIRGDTQSTLYSSCYVKNRFSERVKNPISPLSRFFILDNVRRALVPLFAALSLILSVFLLKNSHFQGIIALTALSYAIFPPIFSILTSFSSISGSLRRFFSGALPRVGSSLFELFFGISSVFAYAVISLDALFKGFVRSRITHKKTLSWTVSSHEIKNCVFSQISWGILSYICGFLALSFGASATLRFFGILWIFLPLTLLLLSIPRKGKKAVSESEKAQILRLNYDMWSFFAKYVTEKENFLPPDNVQFVKKEKVAHRTSPTNIGMYLLSCLAACDCGFIDAHSLYERLDNSLNTVERLPKKYGHLYNWYDTETLDILGEVYISSVDSGNFIASLIVLSEGLDDYKAHEKRLENIKVRLENIINSTDFSKLYCNERNLFYIGIDASGVGRRENCYDLYMSESRTLSYIVIAKKAIPEKHWTSLSRTAVSKNGYSGILSWSGSMFEYFMPRMFLPAYENSLSGEALAFAAYAQQRRTHRGVWGISESGYHAFDSEMNYQYRANGVPCLALDPSIGKEVTISPYASFLSLPVLGKNVFKNLERLKSFGMYGEHGFYESLDMTASRVGNSPECVRSYMSHHVGMSIISATNYAFDNIFVKRFMKNPEISSARELLCEAVQTDGKINSPLRKKLPKTAEKPTFQLSKVEKSTESGKSTGNMPSVCLISSESASIYLSDIGQIMLMRGETMLTSYPFDTRDMLSHSDNSLKFFFMLGENIYTLIPDSMTFSGTRALYRQNISYGGENISLKLSMSLMPNEDIFVFKFSLNGKFSCDFSPMIAFEVLLTTFRDRVSHPFYGGLSVEAIFDRELNILIFHARSKNGENDKWLSVSLENYPSNVTFDSRHESLPLNYTDGDISEFLRKDLRENEGACVSPYCLLKGEKVSIKDRFSCIFMLVFGESREEITQKVKHARENATGDLVGLCANKLCKISQDRLVSVGLAPNFLKYSDIYLASLFFAPNDREIGRKTFKKNSLWACGISGDLPIVSVNLPDEFSESAAKVCEIFIKLHRLCRLRGKESDLVFIACETDLYNAPKQKKLFEIISKCSSDYLLSRRGGIFIIRDISLSPLFEAVSSLYVPLEKSSSAEEIFHCASRHFIRKRENIRVLYSGEKQKPLHSEKEIILKTNGGIFTENGFICKKSREKLVHCYIYANRVFGTLLSENSLGYTWFANAKEMRLTPYFSSIRRDISGERLIFLSQSGEKYDIIASSYYCAFERGAAHYITNIDGVKIEVYVGVDEKLPVKTLSVSLSGELSRLQDIIYDVEPCIGENVCQPNMIRCQSEGDTKFFRRRYDSHLSEHTVFLSSVKEKDFENPENGEKIRKYFFLFGIFPSFSDRAYYHIREKYYCFDSLRRYHGEYARFYRDIFSKMQIESPDKALDEAVNFYIPYQVLTARLFGRTGFYQSSGAYGFRDQLQDSLALLYYEPELCKYQIIRAAAHQYTEGDVQHWWHQSEKGMQDENEKWHAGLRSKCSDDLLWLPYVLSRYLEFTGDYALLDKKIRYIESRELSESEETRYERPIRSKYREPLYDHAVRAIERALNFDEDSLPRIGSCDWNDAFDNVGRQGKGTSVWLAQFLKAVLDKFIPICKMRGDISGAEKYAEISEKLREKIEKNAFSDGQYIRAFYDDGRALGAKGNAECEVDILAQSFAVIAGCDRKRAENALLSSLAKLWDRDVGIVKLFTPAFSGKNEIPGYIVSYCDGIRENGGQYTHGAMWALIALFLIGENEMGYDMLCDISPIHRYLDKERAEIYKTEPYALCGDVYSAKGHEGRGGWSLYTGSASWFVQAVLGYLIGYSENSGESFSLSPHLCEKLTKFTIKRIKDGKEFILCAKYDEKSKTCEITLNGKKIDAENENFFREKSEFT